jgi:type I restriction enzyme M protein
MTVIRRLDALLEPTKDEVLAADTNPAYATIPDRGPILRNIAGHPFYNTSPFTLKGLLNSPNQLLANFREYLDSFSPNVVDILEQFDFRNQLSKLDREGRLGPLIARFTDPDINLSPEPVGNLPGLDNHAMGTVFEELIRRFNEENNEEAGEHFTPRDVITLMADLVVLPIADRLPDGHYLIYDGACGTGGMLTVAEERLMQIAEERGKTISVALFGQEVNPETWAISKADQLIKDEAAENIILGSTIAADAFPNTEFDFMLSNPPYGKSWSADLERLGGKSGIRDSRFIIEHDGNPEYSLLTRSSDGQLMFLANKLAKMKESTELGSRIAEVHNGSSLFTGDAGSGESNIRRWIIENDWLEAIIALPNNMFYNTGIATYIWVLSNRKPAARRGRVQLIDATKQFTPRRKNLGQKNADLSETDIRTIIDQFLTFEESETSKIFPNEAFGYWKVTVERPLRLRTDLDDETQARVQRFVVDAGMDGLLRIVPELTKRLGPGPHLDWNLVQAEVDTLYKPLGLRKTAKVTKLIRDLIAVRDEAAEPVIRSQTGGVIEYEADPELRDTEQIGMQEPGGIQGFFAREVLPHVPDAWLVEDWVKIGYEISFTRYFYKPQKLRTLAEIEADIRALEAETDGLLDQILIEVEA